MINEMLMNIQIAMMSNVRACLPRSPRPFDLSPTSSSASIGDAGAMQTGLLLATEQDKSILFRLR